MVWGERESDADECVYEKCQENLVEGKERKTNLALVENSGFAICRLTDFEAQVLVDQVELVELT